MCGPGGASDVSVPRRVTLRARLVRDGDKMSDCGAENIGDVLPRAITGGEAR